MNHFIHQLDAFKYTRHSLTNHCIGDTPTKGKIQGLHTLSYLRQQVVGHTLENTTLLFILLSLVILTHWKRGIDRAATSQQLFRDVILGYTIAVRRLFFFGELRRREERPVGPTDPANRVVQWCHKVPSKAAS